MTWRVREEVWNLRSRRAFRVFERALWAGGERFGLRVVEFSVQGNHVHLLCEADDAPCLARGLQGLAIRVAKGLNRTMGRHGKVFADRYHARPLRTPAEARAARQYVLHNRAKHASRAGRTVERGYVDSFSSLVRVDLVAAARGWLLTRGSARRWRGT